MNLIDDILCSRPVIDNIGLLDKFVDFYEKLGHNSLVSLSRRSSVMKKTSDCIMKENYVQCPCIYVSNLLQISP